MSEDTDLWTNQRPLEPSPKQLHALGVIAFRWNRCEEKLSRLFCEITGMDDTLGWILTKDLGDPTIFLRIVEVMKNHPNAFDGSELAVIESLSKHHDVCRVNRNVFIHAVAIGPNDDGGAFFARKNKKRMDHILIGGDLATLRSIANEIIELENFMDDINSYFYERNGAHPSTLPDIPSLPESRQELRPSIPPERRRSPPPSQN